MRVHLLAKMDSTEEAMGSWHHLLWGGTPSLFDLKELSSWEGFLDFENEKYVVSYPVSGQGPASSLNCPAIVILEYWSTGNKSSIAYPGGGEGHLPPASLSTFLYVLPM